MFSKILAIIVFSLAGFISPARADTIYLRNGRNIEGLIIKENDQSVELNVGFGTVKFNREEIKSIYKSKQDEVVVMRQEWQRHKESEQRKKLKREQEAEEARRSKVLEPKEVEFSQASGQIIVNALLNKKVNALLILDTGASLVLLSSRIAKKLGIKTHRAEKDMVQVKLADGSKIDARYIILDSVSVQGIEANDVGAVVLSSDAKMDIQDGLLGMSFLSKFNFQIDTENKKLFLESPQ